jgi:hypothetical protein
MTSTRWRDEARVMLQPASRAARHWTWVAVLLAGIIVQAAVSLWLAMPLHRSYMAGYLRTIGWVTLPFVVAALFAWGMLRIAGGQFGANLAQWFSLICTLPAVCYFLALPFLFRVRPVPDSELKYGDLQGDPAIALIFFPIFHLALVALLGGVFLIIAFRKRQMRA